MSKFGIQYQIISKTIEGGRLNKAGNLFLEKTDQTNNAIAAVADFVEFTLDGHGVIEVGGYKVNIEVENHPHRKNSKTISDEGESDDG